jgi:hypothetical protein
MRFTRKSKIGDDALLDAIDRAERGLIDADLGGGVIKQRVARPGEGKSSGFRVIVFFRHKERAFFVHGFAKNEKDNIQPDELAVLKRLAIEVLAYDDAALEMAITHGTFVEVKRP